MFKLQSYSFSAHKESNVDCKCDITIKWVLWLHYARICGTSKCFMCHICPFTISKKFFQLQWKIKTIHFLVFEIFFMIPVWFLRNLICSLYDYQEFIHVIYDLVWLVRIIYDLVRSQRKLYDRWPGFIFLLYFHNILSISSLILHILIMFCLHNFSTFNTSLIFCQYFPWIFWALSAHDLKSRNFVRNELKVWNVRKMHMKCADCF